MDRLLLRERMKRVTSRASSEDIDKAIELGNQYDPDVFGRFPWDRSERRGKATSLTKNVLGEFVFQVLKCGGNVDSFFLLGKAVFIRVHLSISQKELLEELTPFRFDPPPTVDVT